ncbi:MAG TPA: preprotein translocase subunit SecE [Candidatus Omnitrophota bacterium]|nr:preprotein translocase subunit SecE [Candidatus Omnitrophota bacterium]
MFDKVGRFFSEVKVELTKVSWPNRQELVASTWLIIIMTALLAVFIGFTDLALSKMLGLLVK